MANTKTLQTRLQLKYDTYANWTNENLGAGKGANLVLLEGEIGICEIPSGNAAATTAPTVLFKVGGARYTAADAAEGKGTAGELMKFKHLPWASAKAADVYSWAKTATAEAVPVKMTDAAATGSPEITGKTLRELLELINGRTASNIAALSALSAKVDVEKVSTAISNAISTEINKLDSTVTGSGAFVKSVSQTNGVVNVTLGGISESELPDISANKIIVENASGDKAAVTAADRFETISGELSRLSNAVVGGVHFVGTVTTVPTSDTITLSGSTTSYKAVSGDVVIYATTGTEYIYTGSAWEVLGDATRIGDLETKVANLDYAGGSFGTSKFATKVTQTDGKIAVEYTQPKAADVLYKTGSTDTVFDVLEDISAKATTNGNILAGIGGTNPKATVVDYVTDKINSLDYSDPTTSGDASGDTISFIAGVSQTNGQLSATKKNIPAASTTQKGIVKLNNTVTSASTFEAATANAVKTAYDKADKAAGAASTIGSNYLKYVADATDTSKPGKLVIGTNGNEDYLIFNCGSATEII